MYLLMGQPGSGKGTQGEMLAKKLGYDYFSTGHYLRIYMTQQRKKEILEGKLINDREMIEIIKTFLDETQEKNKIILDGFPRTLNQVNWLIDNQGKFTVEGIIFLDVPEDKLLKRLLERARPDDTEQAIKQRFKDYLASTAPVIDYCKSHNIEVYEIDGDNDIDKVQSDILEKIN